MADDFVKEEVEDYKEEDMHFHSSVAYGSDDQDTRSVIDYFLVLLLNNKTDPCKYIFILAKNSSWLAKFLTMYITCHLILYCVVQ